MTEVYRALRAFRIESYWPKSPFQHFTKMAIPFRPHNLPGNQTFTSRSFSIPGVISWSWE